jgi:uncharacterized membrane protein YbaN (DUF454 family)
MSDGAPPALARPHNNRWVRWACLAAGFVALALGLAGIVLPVLPTTPFVLLAAACFARSSVRVHDALLAHRVAGPLIREWQTHRAMPRQAKRVGFALMAVSFGSSILMMDSPWHRLMLAALGAVLAYFLWRVPVRELDAADRAPGGAAGPAR